MMNKINPASIEMVFFWYFLSINVVYSILLFLGAIRVYQRRKELSVEDFTNILHSNSLPEIAFIVPMHNEAKNICGCIQSILNLTYRYKQIIAVNDGSKDNTLQVLKEQFDLVPIPHFFAETIPAQPVRQVLRSRTVPELLVIDKPHAGKYDAVNVGVNACENPFFIAVDADVFIDNKGFEALIRPLLAYPETVAIGGTVRIKNGCTLDFNRINTKKISFHFLPMFQGLEYLRSFLQRQGWDYLAGNFVIAGAFSIFPTELIRKTGGFSSCIAEDMEIVVRLHRVMKRSKIPYRVFYLPDPIAWTEGPSTLGALGRQRTRWHLGLLETLWYHKGMCLNPRYGFFGLFNYPFWIWGEAIEPVMEALGYTVVLIAWAAGLMNGSFALLLILITLGFAFVYSLACLLIEEASFRKYTSFKTIMMMFLLSLIENCGYRQLTVYWRIKSFAQFFRTFRQTHRESKRLQRLMKK
ncbi:MAG: glycosyltransferase family 2 protein [Simkania sp.]|nr:glycosyltransferase family 2 protein [Simkania sp.]